MDDRKRARAKDKKQGDQFFWKKHITILYTTTVRTRGKVNGHQVKMSDPWAATKESELEHKKRVTRKFLEVSCWSCSAKQRQRNALKECGKCGKFMQHLETCLLIAEADRVLCHLVGFSNGLKKWNTAATKNNDFTAHGLFVRFLVKKSAACQKFDFGKHRQFEKWASLHLRLDV